MPRGLINEQDERGQLQLFSSAPAFSSFGWENTLRTYFGCALHTLRCCECTEPSLCHNAELFMPTAPPPFNLPLAHMKSYTFACMTPGERVIRRCQMGAEIPAVFSTFRPLPSLNSGRRIVKRKAIKLVQYTEIAMTDNTQYLIAWLSHDHCLVMSPLGISLSQTSLTDRAVKSAQAWTPSG